MEPEECEEPRCRNPSLKSWGGRKVCRDHYEQYNEQQERVLMDMRDQN